jgi:hypothetical protein
MPDEFRQGVNFEVIKSEMENMKNDINEMKESQKEDRNLFLETIASMKDSQSVLKENIVKLTTLQEQMNKRANRQDDQIKEVDERQDKRLKVSLMVVAIIVSILTYFAKYVV